MPRLMRMWQGYRPGGFIAPQTPTVQPVVGNFGPDFRNWMRQPGDQHLIVPNGTYTAGSIALNRTPTGGAYNGWLVLEAQTPGGVVIDQSYPGKSLGGGLTANGDLVIENGHARTLLLGMKFQGGTLRGATYPTVAPYLADYFFEWYCEHTFPVATWAAEPGYGTPTQYHDTFRTVDLRYGAQHFEFYGCDFHDTGAAVFPRSGATPYTFVGGHVWNLNANGHLDAVHPDGIGAVGGGYNGDIITDSLIDCSGAGNNNTGIIIETATGSDGNITLARLWIPGNSTSGGLNLLAYNGRTIAGTMNDVAAWGNGIFDLNEQVDGVDHLNDPNWSPRIQFTGTGNTFGVAQTGTDPATAWRAAHPYSSWSTFFAGKLV